MRASALALAAAPLLASSSRAGAQVLGVSARPDWSASGPLTGREPVDPAALTDEERMHVPVLTLPPRVRAGRPFELVVQIGVRPHEQLAAHHVDWIDVCVGERRIFVADLSVEVPWPIVRVPIVLSERALLGVRARCSQHGVWITRRLVEAT